MISRLKSARGATLIETIIYAALLAMFIGATFAFVASILGSTDTLLERNEIVAAAEFVELKLAWLMGQANGVNVPVPSASSTALTIVGTDGLLFPAMFAKTTTTITLALPGTPASALTNTRVTVPTFLVEHFSTNQGSSTLRVTIEVRSALYPHLVTSSTSYYAIPE
ncbi:MAG: hypothetical protein V1885_00595 [Candidatus Brennerbacteria bacterium]